MCQEAINAKADNLQAMSLEEIIGRLFLIILFNWTIETH
jgi:hypothetical protein